MGRSVFYIIVPPGFTDYFDVNGLENQKTVHHEYFHGVQHTHTFIRKTGVSETNYLARFGSFSGSVFGVLFGGRLGGLLGGQASWRKGSEEDRRRVRGG